MKYGNEFIRNQKPKKGKLDPNNYRKTIPKQKKTENYNSILILNINKEKHDSRDMIVHDKDGRTEEKQLPKTNRECGLAEPTVTIFLVQ